MQYKLDAPGEYETHQQAGFEKLSDPDLAHDLMWEINIPMVES